VRIAIALVLLVAAAQTAAAQTERQGASKARRSQTTTTATFGQANERYTRGEYEKAAVAYEQLVDRGVESESLYYNLGNAYFRVGRLGPAVYNYERALRLDPNFEDARYNLRVAREVVAERFGSRLKAAETDPVWVRVSTFWPMSRMTALFLALNVLFFGVLIGLRFIAEGLTRTALVVVNAFVGVALAASLAMLIGHAVFLERVNSGIVLDNQVVMREGADARFAERGLLHPGLRVRVQSSDGEWLRVRLSNGVDGWVPRSSIGRL
jgi:tetratricopeptide (TPR) repeat protein